MNILGLTGALGWDGNIELFEVDLWVHGSSASLVCDGKYMGSAEEERFTRKKHEGNYPQKSIDALLQKGNITSEEVDVVAFVGTLCYLVPQLKNSGYIEKQLKEKFPNAEIKFVDHHTAHAFNTFGTSKFDQANIFTFDGAGERHYNPATNTYDLVNNSIFANGDKKTKKFEIINTSYLNNDTFHFGTFFNTLCYTVWEFKHKDEKDKKTILRETVQGKIMGMSGYGRAENCLIDKPFKIVQPTPYHFPQVKMDMSILNNLWNSVIYGNVIFTPEDLAAWTQKTFEDNVIEFLDAIPSGYKRDYLCIGGGCGLNILTNSRIIGEGLYKDVHVHPATGDDGLSLGAALSVAFDNGIDVVLPANIGTVGISYSDEQALEALSQYSDKVSYKKLEDDELNTLVVDKLVRNEIVAWHQGESEFGPRALCNRSILSNPQLDNKQLLNEKVKFREPWRPYAAAILEEDLDEWIDTPKKDSPYMLFSGTVQESKRKIIPGVVHVDFTCRVQTVSEANNSKMFKLLSAFKDKTKVPLLLNTSFNTIPGEPIVETPEDAIKSFLYSKVDTLVINNFVIEKIGEK